MLARIYTVSISIGLILLLSACTSLEDLPFTGDALPGKGVSVRTGQATWDTGWFQAQVFKLLLEELGYDVREPETLDAVAFYFFSAGGDVDFWPNGWFPLHDHYLEFERVSGKITPVGFQVEGGALQGYLIDTATANQVGITNLGQLKQPDIAALFDRDDDGKADLVGCNPGWGCERVIEHHLDAYGLRDTVTHVQGDYTALMKQTIEAYQDGEPILFYTWTPNWTVSALSIGEDVMWLGVPFSSLPDHSDASTEVESLPGCLEAPCNTGFGANDIRVVANVEFLAENPAAAKLLESVEIPLADIAAQNARMLAGEKEQEDIRRHAVAWIEANRELVDAWLADATAAAR